MAQLLDIFAFVSVILRGLTLTLEALVIGGVIFLLGISKSRLNPPGTSRRFLRCFSALLIIVQLGFVGANSAILMTSAGLTWAEVIGANFCIAGGLMALGAAVIGGFVRTRAWKLACPVGCLLVLTGAVMTSHSVARLEHRAALVFLTTAHHLAGAAWIGGLPYLLWTLRNTSYQPAAERVVARFSRMATIAVPLLVGAGLAMSFLYVSTGTALIGTTYGVMLLSKVLMTALVIALGGLNLKIVRAVRTGSSRLRKNGDSQPISPSPFAGDQPDAVAKLEAVPIFPQPASVDLLPLRRFGEVEVGIGFTVILAAASLTSSPPAMDVRERVSTREIAERSRPQWPLLETPALADLSPPGPVTPNFKPAALPSLVPGQQAQTNNNLADIAWSEYNHHWAGLIVLAAGVLALLARHFAWARHWPLVFLALAVFLFLRSDAENWPLGPRGFWESFQVAEVAQHRIFVVLIVAFGLFEWSVRNGRIRPEPYGLVFPLVCAIGGALLLTHSHSLVNVKEEFLAELSHLPLAVLGVVAGWSRWLEIRLPEGRGGGLQWVWPLCFVCIGCLLLNYREA